MKCENKLGMDFNSLPERILYAYKAAYPEFIPCEDVSASEESQKQMHDFLYDTICQIYINPQIIGIANEPDQYYENWMLNNQKPELILAMGKIEKKLFDFYEYLIKIGNIGEEKDNRLFISKSDMKITKATLDKLALFGLSSESTKDHIILYSEKYPLIFPAWKLYSQFDTEGKIKTQQIMIFLHGRFNGKTYKAVNLFGDLCPNRNLLDTLENYFQSNGFSLTNDELRVNWQKDYPRKERAYMRVFFDWRKKHQMTYEFRVQQFRGMLHSYEKMDKDLQELVFNRTKTCDGCGYCTQTDKSGKRAILAQELQYDGTKLYKCPLFPYLTWNYIDADILSKIIKLFDFSGKTTL